MLLGVTWSRCNSPCCSAQPCKTHPAAYGQGKGAPREHSPALSARNGAFTPANYSLQHQLHSPQAPTSAPSSVLSPSEEKTKLFTISPSSSSFLPHKEELARSASFFPELFPLSDVKSICRTARFHAEMSTLSQQWCPCGCTQGWQQLPGHQRTLCVETGSVRSRAALL